jgi:hypothetical protein
MKYYKYLPTKRLTYLDDQLLRFSQPGDLNDPFECLPQKPSKYEIQLLFMEIAKKLSKSQDISEIGNTKFYEIIEKYIIDIDEENPENLLEIYYNSAQAKMNSELGILSLSKNWNSTLMWSHYTISHKGYCVGFDPSHSFFKDYLADEGKKSRLTREVKYSTDRVKVPMELGKRKIGLEPFLTKSNDWKYEEEVRVLGSLNLASKVISNDNFPINLFEVPHSALSEVIAGANISNENFKKIYTFCSKNKVNFFQSRISEIKYNMERTRKI